MGKINAIVVVVYGVLTFESIMLLLFVLWLLFFFLSVCNKKDRTELCFFPQDWIWISNSKNEIVHILYLWLSHHSNMEKKVQSHHISDEANTFSFVLSSTLFFKKLFVLCQTFVCLCLYGLSVSNLPFIHVTPIIQDCQPSYSVPMTLY